MSFYRKIISFDDFFTILFVQKTYNRKFVYFVIFLPEIMLNEIMKKYLKENWKS